MDEVFWFHLTSLAALHPCPFAGFFLFSQCLIVCVYVICISNSMLGEHIDWLYMILESAS